MIIQQNNSFCSRIYFPLNSVPMIIWQQCILLEDMFLLLKKLLTNSVILKYMSASVQFSCRVVSDSLWPHGLQHARPPCPSPTPRACSSSCLLIQWCHLMPSNHLILCCPLLLLPSIFPSIGVFSSELALCFRWPKYWSISFSISLCNECSVLISFRIDWFDLLAVQGTLKSSPTWQFKSINSLALSFLYGPTLTLLRQLSHCLGWS